MTAAPPGRRKSAAASDSVSRLIDQWHHERPDLDPRVPSIVARLLRLASHLRKRAEQFQTPLGVTWETGEILLALLRSGTPYRMTPTALFKSMLLTSGAMTNRLDRAETAGLVVREADPQDRRSVAVRLTPQGLALAHETVTLYYAEMGRLLDGLGKEDAKELARILALFLGRVEQEHAADSTAPVPRVLSRRKVSSS